MANFHSPNISTNGLVLCLDAANKQSYNAEHNLMFYSGLQGASGATLPTGYLPAQYMASTIAPSNNTSITVDGVGYWQFDLVGTTPAGNNNQLLIDSTLMTGIKPATSYTITYNYAFLSSANISGDGISRNYADIGGITVYVFWYDTNNTLLSFSSQNNNSNNLSFWQRSSATGKSSYTAVAPANAVKAKLRFAFYNPVAGGTAINWVGFRLGGIQVEERNASGNYVATTATQVLPTIVWKDLSGNGNNGTLSNGPTYSSENGGSIVFDGIDDNCILNTFADLEQSSFTFEVVFKTTAADTRLIVGKYSGSGGDYWLGTQPKLNWSFGSPAKVDIRSIANVNDNVYRLAHAIYDKSTSQTFLYVNGIFQSQGAVPGTITSATGNLRLGTWDTGGFLFPGSLPIFKIYNRALSAAEIQQNFNALRGRFGI